MEPKEVIEMVAKELGLTMTTTFVPWSVSRNAGEKQRSLNWKIALLKDGKEFLTTDYMAGIGHCPSYKGERSTIDGQALLNWECENGKVGWSGANGISSKMRRVTGVPNAFGNTERWQSQRILPDLAGVIASLCMDAEAIDRKSFSEWATDLGYNADSIKAHETYKACLSIGLALRCALGDEGLTKLRRACENC